MECCTSASFVALLTKAPDQRSCDEFLGEICSDSTGSATQPSDIPPWCWCHCISQKNVNYFSGRTTPSLEAPCCALPWRCKRGNLAFTVSKSVATNRCRCLLLSTGGPACEPPAPLQSVPQSIPHVHHPQGHTQAEGCILPRPPCVLEGCRHSGSSGAMRYADHSSQFTTTTTSEFCLQYCCHIAIMTGHRIQRQRTGSALYGGYVDLMSSCEIPRSPLASKTW